MKGNEHPISISGDVFKELRQDIDTAIMMLIKDLVDKDGQNGVVTAKINIGVLKNYVDNYDPNILSDKRLMMKVAISHVVNRKFELKEESKGKSSIGLGEDEEMIFDEDTGMFVIVPVTGQAQQSIFDVQYADIIDPDNSQDDSDSLIEKAITADETRFLSPPDDYSYDDPK